MYPTCAMSATTCVAKPSRVTPEMKRLYDVEYAKLKRNFISNSKNAAKLVTAASLFSFDVNCVSSVALGSLCSTLYAQEYIKYVDRLDKSSCFPYHLGIPLAMVLTETTINHSSFHVHLDYIQVFAAFLSYKYALFKILVDSLKK